MPSALETLAAQIERMAPQARKELEGLVAAELGKPWKPQAGPQSDAYTSDADLILYGGAAGGGKTDLIIGLGLNNHHRVGVFRQHSGEMTGLIDRMQIILGQAGLGRVTGNPQKWDGPDGKKFEFGHLSLPGSEKSWQGRDHDLKCFDEAAQMNPAKVLFVMGWNRTTKPGQRCRTLLCSNPPIGGDGDYLVEWFGPWLDPLHPLHNTVKPGQLLWAVFDGTHDDIKTIWCEGPKPVEINGQMRTPKSRTFIPAHMSDNKYLGEEYRATIDAMPEPMRTALLTGDFMASHQDHDYQVIPTDWIQAAMNRWTPNAPGPMDVIGVDVAQGGKDRTTLAPLHGTWFGPLTVKEGKDTRDGVEVGSLVVNMRRNDALVAVDCTGGWGGDTVGFLSRQQNIPCVEVVFSKGSGAQALESKIPFINLRAEMYWRLREALHPKSGDGIALPPSQRLKAQLAAPRWKLRNQSIQIESKDDIKSRVGGSPDEADAVVIAWLKRDEGAFRRVKDRRSFTQQAALDEPF
ncbi:MAG: terminase family protein [Kordiimonadaceae bacterium]|nr:terminase family protein [Kordiimonadaceae bacterium]